MKFRIIQVAMMAMVVAGLCVSSIYPFPYQSTYQATKNGVTVTLVDYMLKPDAAVLALWGFLPNRSIKASQLTGLGIRPVEITVSADKDVIVRAENIQCPQVAVADVQARISALVVPSIVRRMAKYWGGLFCVQELLSFYLPQLIGGHGIGYIQTVYRALFLGISPESCATEDEKETSVKYVRKVYFSGIMVQCVVSSIAAYITCKTERDAITQAVAGATMTARSVSGGHGQQDFYLYIDNYQFADKKISLAVQDYHTNETVADFEFMLN